jgi:SAM-dependent methyltransferase
MKDKSEAKRLQEFWNSRYQDFSLRESGIKALTPAYSELLYQCKKEAYRKALSCGGIDLAKTVRILDGGCGQGFFGLLARDLFKKASYTGLDISEKAIAYLKTFLPDFTWACADLSDAEGLTDQVFDIVQSVEVLHLILDDANHSQAIRNLVACLAPEGILIITDILPEDWTRINEYIIFRPLKYYDKLFAELKLDIVGLFPMYYWIPDMGIASLRLRRFFRLLPPSLMYCLDRLFLRTGIPQFRQSHDSKMKMIVCRIKS